MNGKLIGTIYFYLVSIIGLILLIIGTSSAVTLGLSLTQYDKYPLRYGGIERCNYPPIQPVDKEAMQDTTPNKFDQENRKTCLEQLETERKEHKMEDIKNTITFLTIGGLLFLTHFPQAQKRSRS